MHKIPSLFQRNYNTDRLIRNEVVPGCEWVLAGEGFASQKLDGCCTRIQCGTLWKRFELKAGKPSPKDFQPAQNADDITGDTPGWLPIGDGPEDKWFRVALENTIQDIVEPLRNPAEGSTFEAIGPHFQGNPERWHKDMLVPHGDTKLASVPRTFEGIRDYLKGMDIEGIVFWHPDGRMAKVKKKDYGMKRKPVL